MSIRSADLIQTIDRATYDKDRNNKDILQGLNEDSDWFVRINNPGASEEECADEYWVKIASRGKLRGWFTKKAKVCFVPLTDDALPKPELAETRKVLADGTITLKFWESVLGFGGVIEYGYINDQKPGQCLDSMDDLGDMAPITPDPNPLLDDRFTGSTNQDLATWEKIAS